jgi:hypothetical protein
MKFGDSGDWVNENAFLRVFLVDPDSKKDGKWGRFYFLSPGDESW